MTPLLKENLITTKDAGELSGYTSDYLARLARSGKISGRRIGHSWLIDRESLTRFLSQQDDRKIDYARALARAREAEYRAHRSLIHRATRALTNQASVPEFGMAKSSFRAQALALITAFLVVASGALAAQVAAMPDIAEKAVSLASEAASGFGATFGDIPARIASKIGEANESLKADASRIAENTTRTSAQFASPTLTAPNLSSLQMALAGSESPRTAARTGSGMLPLPSASIPPITIEDVQAAALNAYAFVTQPSRITGSLANAYVALGTDAYGTIIASFSAYRSLIEDSGAETLALAATTRDALGTAPRLVGQMNLAFGTSIIDATHALIRADVATACGLAAAAPESARITVALAGNVGGTLALATARIPALAAGLYLGAASLPATLAPSIAQGVFNAEYAGAVHFVKATNGLSEGYLASIATAGALAYEGAKNTRDGIAATGPLFARAPLALEDAYLGVLGKSAVALDAVVRVPKAAAVFSAAQTTAAPMLAAVLPGLSAGEQVALTTYETVNDLFNSAQRALAVLFSPPPIVVPPGSTSSPRVTTIATSTQTTVNSYPTYTTVTQGVSQDFVNQSLAKLRTDVLATVAGMIQPVAAQGVTNMTTIQQVNMIQKLDGLIVTRGDFRGGTFDNGNVTNGILVSATTGHFDNLTAGTTTISGDLTVSGSGSHITAPYFVATSNTSTSTYAGSLNANNGGFVYAVSTKNVGIGVLSPAALLAVQNSTSTQPIFTANNAAGTEVYRITDSGFVGIGTSSPAFTLAVEGSSSLGNQATAGYFTATTSTATSTFAGSLAVGTNSPSGNGLFFVGTSSPLLFVSNSTGNVGIGTSSPSFTFALEGSSSLGNQATAGYFTATTSVATSTFAGGFTLGGNGFVYQQATKNIGIGTTTPDALLSLLQSANGTPFISAYRITDSAPSGDFINFKTNAGTTLFRVDNSGNLLAGGIVNSGSQTITSASTPQFRVQYDASNEWTAAVGSAGNTTFGINGSTPSLTFTPQSNSVNTFNFTNALGTNSVLSIDTLNKRVGIGTTSPWAQFAIAGIAGTSAPLLAISTTTSSAATSTAFLIDSNGNVRIGAPSSPTSTSVPVNLEVRNLADSNVSVVVTGNGATDLRRSLSTGTADLLSLSGTVGSRSIRFITGDALTSAGGTETTRMYIDGSTGNVGIGTTSPSLPLSVQGSGLFSGNISAANLVATGTLAVGGTSATVIAGDGNASTIYSPLTIKGTSSQASSLTLQRGNNGGNNTITFNDQTGTALLQIYTDANTGNARIVGDQSNLTLGTLVGGTALSIDTSHNVNTTANIIPTANQAYDLGSAADYWRNFYVNNVSANNLSSASTSIAGTNNTSFSINSNNPTTDTQDMSLIFYRGAGAPSNAVLSWNSTLKRFEFNQNAYITNASASTASTTLTIAGVAGQTAPLTSWIDSLGNSLATFTAGGSLGIGTTTPQWPLEVLSSSKPQLTLSGTGANFWSLREAGGNLYFATSSPTTFATSSDTRLTLSSSGGVGIGATNPFAALDLRSNDGAAVISNTNGNILNDTATLYLNPANGFTNSSFWNKGPAIAGIVDNAGNTASGLALYTYGGSSQAERVRITSAGNVGIGTTTPDDKLVVESGYIKAETTGAGSLGFRIKRTGGNNVDDYIYASSADQNLSFAPAGVVAGVFSNSGLFGLGTTSPSQVLSVQGNGLFSGNISAANLVATGTLAVSGATTFGGAITFPLTKGNFIVGNDAGTSQATSTIFISSTGNVGIGTTTPQWPLEVLNSGKAQLTLSGTGTNLWSLREASGNLYFATSSPTTFATSTDTRFALSSAGFVGIGTANPAAPLDIVTATNPAELRLSSTAGPGNSMISFYSDRGTGSEWRPGYIQAAAGGSFTGTLNFYTNGTGSGNKLGSVLGASITQDNFTIQGSPSTATSTLTFAPSAAEAGKEIRLKFSDGSTGDDFLSYYSRSINTQIFSFADLEGGGDTSNPSVGIGYKWDQIPDGTLAGSLFASGNIGIGTTTPWAQLSVNPNGVTGAEFAVGSSTATNFVITNGGKVGIGGPTNPLGLLTLENDANDGVSAPNGDILFVDHNAAGASVTPWTHAAIYSVGQGGYNGDLVFATDGDSINNNNPTEKMRLLANGNLGIGTSTPYGVLSVQKASSAAPQFLVAYDAAHATSFTVLSNGTLTIAPKTGSFATTTISSSPVLIGNSSFGDATFEVNTNGGGWSYTPILAHLFTEQNGGVALKAEVGNGSNSTVNDGIIIARRYDSAASAAAGSGIGLTYQIQNSTGVQENTGAIKSLIETTGSTLTAGLAFFSDNAGTSAERVRITGTGKVGIATSSPTSLFTLQGAGTGTGIPFLVTDSNGSPTLWTYDNGNVDIKNNLEITSAGNTAFSLELTNQKIYQNNNSQSITIAGLRRTGNGGGAGADAVVLSSTNIAGTELQRLVVGGFTDTPAVTLRNNTNFGIASNTPYAALSVVGLNTASTTVAFRPIASQTANILDIYDTTGALSSVITAGGNFGIGTSSPTSKLSVTNTVAAAQFTVAYDATRYANFQVNSSGDLIIHSQSSNTHLDDDNLFVCAGGACPAGTPAGTGNLVVETALGVGTSSPAQQLGVANNLFVGGGGNPALGTATSTFAGDVKILGKLDVSTIDPVYTIDGVKYATYGASSVGVKEETSFTVKATTQDPSTGEFEYAIDFNTLEKGSDTWLFYQATNFGDQWKDLIVTLTPGFEGTAHYVKDAAHGRLLIAASKPGEISVRLVANRFDSSKWPNLRPDQGVGWAGFVLKAKEMILGQ